MKMLHVTIQTEKFEAEVQFYLNIVGLKMITDMRPMGMQMVFLADNEGDTEIEIIDNPEANISNFISNIEQIANDAGIPIKNLHEEADGIFRNIEDYVDNGMRDYSNEMNDTELMQEFIKGDKTKDELKDLGVEISDKTKFSNAVKKLYDDGEIDNETAIKVMEDSGLYDDPDRSQPTDSYIEGKVEWWNITKKYKDKYVDSLDSKGNITAESRKIISQIANEPYSNAFWNSPKVKTTWKSYKSPYEKLYNRVTKWKKTE